MPDAIDHDIESSVQRMDARLSQVVAALPDGLKQREDQMLTRLRSENASAKAKLRRIYAFVDEYAVHRAPFVACRAGCASCCHMNVQMSSLEASRIEAGTGRRAKILPSSISRKEDHFAGQACPFLKDSACSIYADRPYVCRNHASFDVDAYWCDPTRMVDVQVPLVELSGVKAALHNVIASAPRAVIADIRDFFPPTP